MAKFTCSLVKFLLESLEGHLGACYVLTWFDSVQHCECVVRGQRRDVEIVNTVLLRCQRRQFVEVSGKQTEAADFGRDVLTDGPGQTEAIVRGRSSAELINYDKRVLGGGAGGTSVDDEEQLEYHF